jgi:hypothetical protein
MQDQGYNLSDEQLEAVPERGKFAGLAGLQGQHGVVVNACFLHVGELRQKETEIHGVSPGVWLDAIQRKPADPKMAHVIRAATQIYSLPSDKRNVERHMG